MERLILHIDIPNPFPSHSPHAILIQRSIHGDQCDRTRWLGWIGKLEVTLRVRYLSALVDLQSIILSYFYKLFLLVFSPYLRMWIHKYKQQNCSHVILAVLVTVGYRNFTDCNTLCMIPKTSKKMKLTSGCCPAMPVMCGLARMMPLARANSPVTLIWNDSNLLDELRLR